MWNQLCLLCIYCVFFAQTHCSWSLVLLEASSCLNRTIPSHSCHMLAENKWFFQCLLHGDHWCWESCQFSLEGRWDHFCHGGRGSVLQPYSLFLWLCLGSLPALIMPVPVVTLLWLWDGFQCGWLSKTSFSHSRIIVDIYLYCIFTERDRNGLRSGFAV